jgi:hypothetical protein
MQIPNDTESDQPPLFKSWRPVYGLVIGALIAQIVVFYAITKYFE